MTDVKALESSLASQTLEIAKAELPEIAKTSAYIASPEVQTVLATLTQHAEALTSNTGAAIHNLLSAFQNLQLHLSTMGTQHQMRINQAAAKSRGEQV